MFMYVCVHWYQLRVVCGQAIFVGIGEEEQLRVWVDGQVRLDDGLVGANEVSQVLGLNLRLWTASTVGVRARVAGSSNGLKRKGHATNCWKTFLGNMPWWVMVMKKQCRPAMKLMAMYSLHHPASKFLLGSAPTQLLPLLLERVFLHILSYGSKQELSDQTFTPWAFVIYSMSLSDANNVNGLWSRCIHSHQCWRQAEQRSPSYPEGWSSQHHCRRWTQPEHGVKGLVHHFRNIEEEQKKVDDVPPVQTTGRKQEWSTL